MAAKKRPKIFMAAKKRVVPDPAYDLQVEEFDADTIPVFCKTHRIPAFYYKLKVQGKTPDEMWLGNKRLISREARERWPAEREAETKNKIAAEVEADKTTQDSSR